MQSEWNYCMKNFQNCTGENRYSMWCRLMCWAFGRVIVWLCRCQERITAPIVLGLCCGCGADGGDHHHHVTRLLTSIVMIIVNTDSNTLWLSSSYHHLIAWRFELERWRMRALDKLGPNKRTISIYWAPVGAKKKWHYSGVLDKCAGTGTLLKRLKKRDNNMITRPIACTGTADYRMATYQSGRQTQRQGHGLSLMLS